MEHDSSIKTQNFTHTHTTGPISKHAEQQTLDPKEAALCDSIYTKFNRKN